MKRDISERALGGELAEMHSRFAAILEHKVDLREVQQALNECQSDIKEQLLEFRASVQNDQRQAEAELKKLIDKKAGVLDLQEALQLKADVRNIIAKSEFEDWQYRVEKVTQEVGVKLDTKYFEEFDELLKKKVEEL